jgi:hypothetical protein
MSQALTQKTNSEIEDRFLNQLRAARLPLPETQVEFHPKRKWRLDFAWSTWMFAVEINGGTFVSGRHNRGAGMRKDRIKIAEAVLAGWTVLEFTGEQVTDGEALVYVIRVFNQFLEAENGEQKSNRYG